MKTFNPTLVRLRLAAIGVSSFANSTFNPTLVRLRPAHGLVGLEPCRGFQSHAGSIEAIAVVSIWDYKRYLSIPRWFD